MPRRLKLKGGDENNNNASTNNNNRTNNYANQVRNYRLDNNGSINELPNNNGRIIQLPNSNRNNLSDVPPASEITLVLPEASTLVFSPTDEEAFRSGFSHSEPIRRIGDDIVVYKFATNEGRDIFFVSVDVTTGEVEEITHIFNNDNSQDTQIFYDDGSSMVIRTNPGYPFLEPENMSRQYPELGQYLKDVYRTEIVYHIDSSRHPLEEEMIKFETPTHTIKIRGDEVFITGNKRNNKNKNNNNNNMNNNNAEIVLTGLGAFIAAGLTGVGLKLKPANMRSSKPANTTAVVGGRRYKVHTGMRGGKYIIRNNKRMYV